MTLNIQKYIPCNYLYTDKNCSLIISISNIYLYTVLNFLKLHQNFRFNLLSTISCVDYPQLDKRFELNYILMSLDFPFILIVKTKVSEYENVFSCSLLYKSSIWLEREVWDLFGVYFKNNFDLRRILTDYGFPYHPLRKTFPLQGFNQIHYSFIKKKIYYIPNKFSQTKPLKLLNNPWLHLKF